MRILIKRFASEENQTLGILYLLNDFGGIEYMCYTLELSWQDNVKYISSIPKGIYTAVRHNSPKFGECLWLQDVPERSEILVHPANYYKQLLGCIALGLNLQDIDGDRVLDVTNSKQAVNELLSHIEDEIEIEII